MLVLNTQALVCTALACRELIKAVIHHNKPIACGNGTTRQKQNGTYLRQSQTISNMSDLQFHTLFPQKFVINILQQYAPSLHQIPSKLVQNFLPKPADKWGWANGQCHRDPIPRPNWVHPATNTHAHTDYNSSVSAIT